MSAKKILIGICGGIAAYKTLSLIRLFRKAGCEVKVVATRNALSFVTPLTIETLSNNKLYVDMFEHSMGRTTEHISLAQWADSAVVAPASANIIAKLAAGIADDALTTTLLAFTKPVYIAPAMNENMYKNIAVQNNLNKLKQYHFHIIDPQTGMLACNTEGIGRMASPETIFETVLKTAPLTNKLTNSKKALVTAGPTYEPVDAVRFIGNRSSGLMGFAIAEALAKKGFDVDLITGPTSLTTVEKNIHRIDVNTAEDMLQKCLLHFHQADIVFMAAAVADYTPAEKIERKMKKEETSFHLMLKPTVDILKTIAAQKKNNQIIVGFALETNDEIEHAKQKLHTKNLDFIVLNSLNDKGAGFETLTNKVTLIDKKENIIAFPLKSKQEIAVDIIETVLNSVKS
ncbi:MAG: bifunctional phosphopantothenoylcysteine decarboxylase/phosphopantothenate--cysteine ligase CoaBC [Bacteroidales bacterium]|jgi:phosphopantothenoylcysteine decarboxylase/phosphopantothenate--cysteine ligase|nr:bifunctional phosphopantothenoylcysteine decarboxylase/phosphopantothenate--cysteine ligase CoaBC [Bacteroidales bacterium]